MNRLLPLAALGALLLLGRYFGLPRFRAGTSTQSLSPPVDAGPKAVAVGTAAARAATAAALRRSSHARLLRAYAQQHGYSDRVAFLVDMRIPSGRARFFIYDLGADSLLAAGLVAHGSCNTRFLREPAFSDAPGSGCSSLGRYKVGYAYAGRFGKAFKLYGLDAGNRSAFERFVVLHAYSCVPDAEIYPDALCNSLGCPMLSYRFLGKAAGYIERSKKPILLWIYE